MKIKRNNNIIKKHIEVLIQTSKLAIYSNKGMFIANIILIITSSIIPYIRTLNLQIIINHIQKMGDNNYLFKLVLIYLLLSVSIIICNIVNRFVSEKYQNYLYYDLNCKVLNKTKNFKLRDFENPYIYDMIQRAEQEVGLRPYQIISQVLSLISYIINTILSVSILFKWHKWTVLSLIIFPVISCGYFAKINKEEYKVRTERTSKERLSWYYSNLLNTDTYIKEIKTSNLSDYIFEKFEKLRREFYDENCILSFKRNIITGAYQFLTLLFNLTIIIFAIIETVSSKILLGDFITYVNTVSLIDTNIKNIVNLIMKLYQDALYSKQIVDFFDYESNDDTISDKLCENINKIEFRNVSYCYVGSKSYILKNVNFTLEIGKTVALVGENGSGKTTIIKLLLGLYDDYEGDILINGISLRNIDKQSYREKISAVFQDYNKYQLKVKDNIGFGNLNNMDKDLCIIEAAQKSGADNFIKKLKDGYNQQVGQWFEGGVQLSGGQWQKLAISRAFMKNADIYILDEPTASLDPISEYNFFRNFISHTNKSGSLIVTHRFVNVSYVDEIIVLKNGTIFEKGSHEQLINNNSYYATLYFLQTQS